MNVLVIWDRMGDYHWARINELRRSTENIVFTAELGQADKLYNWKAQSDNSHFVLSDKTVETNDYLKRTKRFIAIIRQQKIKAVFVAGWGNINYILFAVASKLFGLKVFTFVETWHSSQSFIKKKIIKNLFDGFFASGIKAKDYLINSLQIDKNKIVTHYSIVDNNHFYVETNERTWADDFVILCVARFSCEKNLDFLIESFLASKLSTQKSKLILIGGGPLKNKLNSLASLNPEQIQIVDWVSYSDIKFYYKNAHLFILPSLFEPWGLVVNEAMAASLPSIVSKNCGCVPDLIIENKTGFLFEPENRNSLVEIFNKIADKEISLESLREVGYKAQEHVFKNFSINRWALSFNELAGKCV